MRRSLQCCRLALTVATLNPVYTIQWVVNRLSNRFDNRLYCVNGGLSRRVFLHGL